MSPSESNPDRLSMRVVGESAIGQLVDAARAFGTMQRLSRDELARLCIVVEELVANLYDHGGLTAADEVGLRLAMGPEGIQLSITHPGKAFDPWSALRVGESKGRGGGAGVRLIQAWAEMISYRSGDDGSQLELLLPSRRGAV